jgi:hypothetical protein
MNATVTTTAITRRVMERNDTLTSLENDLPHRHEAMHAQSTRAQRFSFEVRSAADDDGF